MDKKNTALNAVIKTLESVSVQGRDNMKKIMLCIQVLERVIDNDLDGMFVNDADNKYENRQE